MMSQGERRSLPQIFSGKTEIKNIDVKHID